MTLCFSAGRWKGDRKWYDGTVTSFDATKDEPYAILYDDGTQESEDLSEVKHEWHDPDPVPAAAVTTPDRPPSVQCRVRFDGGQQRTMRQAELHWLVPAGKVACVCCVGVASAGRRATCAAVCCGCLTPWLLRSSKPVGLGCSTHPVGALRTRRHWHAASGVAVSLRLSRACLRLPTT